MRRPRLLFSIGLAVTLLVLPFFAGSVYWLGYRYYHDHPRVEATVMSLRSFEPRVSGETRYLLVADMMYPVAPAVQKVKLQLTPHTMVERDDMLRRFAPGAHVDVRYWRAKPEHMVLAEHDIMDQQGRITLAITTTLFSIAIGLACLGKHKAV